MDVCHLACEMSPEGWEQVEDTKVVFSSNNFR